MLQVACRLLPLIEILIISQATMEGSPADIPDAQCLQDHSSNVPELDPLVRCTQLQQPQQAIHAMLLATQ